MEALQLALRYVHIFSAIALFGGSIFALVAVAPSLAELEGSARAKLHEAIRLRWRWVVHVAMAGLLVSGIANLGLASQYKFEGPWSMLGGVKLLVALPIFFFAAMLTGSSATALKYRENARFWLRVNVILGTIVVLIGGYMRYIPRELKGQAPTAPVVAPSTEVPTNP